MPDGDVQDGDDLEEEGPAKSQPKIRRTRVTAREAASYRLFQRSQDSNHILRAGCLLVVRRPMFQSGAAESQIYPLPSKVVVVLPPAQYELIHAVSAGDLDHNSIGNNMMETNPVILEASLGERVERIFCIS